MTAKRATLVLNVRSGLAGAVAPALGRAARRAGLDFLEVRRRIDLAVAVRSRLRGGEQHFVVAGGDGTLNKVIREVAGTGATVGVVPLGTYNRFARDAGIPFEWQAALELALHGPIRAIDVGVVNGVPFLSAVTLGIHTALLEERERLRSRFGRALAVGAAGISAFARFPLVQVDVRSDSVVEHVRARVMAVSVNRVDFSDAGAPRPRLDGGLLSLWWIGNTGRTALALDVLALALGWRARASLRELTGTTLTIDCRHGTQKIGIDGEITKMRTPLTIGIRPRGLLVRTHA